jgi:signal transduction histidine kinase
MREKEADAIESISVQDQIFQEQFVKFKIEIIDSGVGIIKENLSKLFMEFGKLDEHSKINA